MNWIAESSASKELILRQHLLVVLLEWAPTESTEMELCKMAITTMLTKAGMATTMTILVSLQGEMAMSNVISTRHMVQEFRHLLQQALRKLGDNLDGRDHRQLGCPLVRL